MHRDIARLLLASVPNAERSPRAVEIVEHLNRVPELPDDLHEPSIRLNHAVGDLALSVGAAAAAAASFAVAWRLLADGCEGVPEAFAFDLQIQSAESEYQLGELDTALALLDAISSCKPVAPRCRARRDAPGLSAPCSPGPRKACKPPRLAASAHRGGPPSRQGPLDLSRLGSPGEVRLLAGA